MCRGSTVHDIVHVYLQCYDKSIEVVWVFGQLEHPLPVLGAEGAWLVGDGLFLPPKERSVRNSLSHFLVETHVLWDSTFGGEIMTTIVRGVALITMYIVVTRVHYTMYMHIHAY